MVPVMGGGGVGGWFWTRVFDGRRSVGVSRVWTLADGGGTSCSASARRRAASIRGIGMADSSRATSCSPCTKPSHRHRLGSTLWVPCAVPFPLLSSETESTTVSPHIAMDVRENPAGGRAVLRFVGRTSSGNIIAVADDKPQPRR